MGTPIISVQVGGGNGSAPATAAAPAATRPQAPPVADAPFEGAVEPGMIGSPAPKAERQAVLVGYGVKLGATTRRQRKQAAGAAPAAAPAAAAPSAAPPASPAPVQVVASRVAVLAKPPVRKLAKDLGVDLTALTGTGPDGVITRDDVQTAAASPATAAPRAAARGTPGEPGSGRSESRFAACASTRPPR